MTAGKILVVGRSGQLAGALVHAAGQQDRPLVSLGRPDLDITDRDSIARALDGEAPAFVINASAYTAVDQAETDREAAFALNADGPRSLAVECRRRTIPLIHVSTDCVFDGGGHEPHTEDKSPKPLGVYGHSKLAGEQAVQEVHAQVIVARVCWVFSRFAGCFVRTMINLAETRDVLRVVDDQFGHPTHASDLARALFQMADAAHGAGFSGWGVYHLAGPSATDRASQARLILSESAARGGPTAEIDPVSTANFAAPAPRPLNARLDASKATVRFGLSFGDWKAQTAETVAEILTERRSGGAPRSFPSLTE